MPTTIIHEASEVVDYSTILSHAFLGLQCKHNHAPCLGNTWPEAALHMWDAKIRRTLARPWPLRTWPEAVRATPGQRPCAQLPPTTNTWPEAVSPSGLAVQAFAPENLKPLLMSDITSSKSLALIARFRSGSLHIASLSVSNFCSLRRRVAFC